MIIVLQHTQPKSLSQSIATLVCDRSVTVKKTEEVHSLKYSCWVGMDSNRRRSIFLVKFCVLPERFCVLNFPQPVFRIECIVNGRWKKWFESQFLCSERNQLVKSSVTSLPPHTSTRQRAMSSSRKKSKPQNLPLRRP